jgi:hypothetical protein
MKLWRCLNENCANCGANYEAPDGECPACHGFLAARLVPACYLVPAEGPIVTGLGNRMVACDPKRKALPESATGHRGSVTCPKCLASAIFKEDEADGTDNHVPYFERLAADSIGRQV